LKKLTSLGLKSYNYNTTKLVNFYHNYFIENYKSDSIEYFNLENVNYKIYINSVFFRERKSFFSSNLTFFNKNKTNLDKLINVVFINGDKLKFFKSLNKVVNVFYFSFIHKSVFLQNKFDNYSLFYNFSKENSFFFDFNFILNNITSLNESIFHVKVLKVNKKAKKKLKKKYDFEVKYLKKEKRAGNVYRSLHLHSNSFNYYKYDERLLASILTTFFFQKSSKLYKKKLLAYSSVLKKKSL
jgi:hypothetical protein